MKMDRVFVGVVGTYTNNSVNPSMEKETVIAYLTRIRKHFVNIDTGEVYPLINASMERPCRGLQQETLIPVAEFNDESQKTQNYVRTKRMKKTWYMK